MPSRCDMLWNSTLRRCFFLFLKSLSGYSCCSLKRKHDSILLISGCLIVSVLGINTLLSYFARTKYVRCIAQFVINWLNLCVLFVHQHFFIIFFSVLALLIVSSNIMETSRLWWIVRYCFTQSSLTQIGRPVLSWVDRFVCSTRCDLFSHSGAQTEWIQGKM